MIPKHPVKLEDLGLRDDQIELLDKGAKHVFGNDEPEKEDSAKEEKSENGALSCIGGGDSRKNQDSEKIRGRKA